MLDRKLEFVRMLCLHFPLPGAKNKSGTTALELAKESPELLKEMQEQLRIRGQGEKVDETMEVSQGGDKWFFSKLN